MARVSRKKLKKEISDNIKFRFSKIVSDLKSSNEAELFLNDLLSDTEETILAKRLALIVMLNNKVPFSIVEKTLEISPATISKVSKILNRGGYQNILRKENQNKTNKEAKMDIEVLFRMGMPEMGRGRWKFLNEYLEKKNKK